MTIPACAIASPRRLLNFFIMDYQDPIFFSAVTQQLSVGFPHRTRRERGRYRARLNGASLGNPGDAFVSQTISLWLCWQLEGCVVEGCFRLVVFLTEVSHLFRMVVIVPKSVIDRCNCESKLIGGYRCVSLSKTSSVISKIPVVSLQSVAHW